jgi:peptidoglycan hydrolase CwlO-like protein
MDTSTILTFLGSVLLSLPGIWALYLQRRKTRAEADLLDAQTTQTLSSTALNLIKPLKEEIDELKAKADQLEKQVQALQDLIAKRDLYIVKLSDDLRRRDLLIEDWTRGIRILFEQLQAANITPLWTPNITIINNVPSHDS